MICSQKGKESLEWLIKEKKPINKLMAKLIKFSIKKAKTAPIQYVKMAQFIPQMGNQQIIVLL